MDHSPQAWPGAPELREQRGHLLPVAHVGGHDLDGGAAGLDGAHRRRLPSGVAALGKIGPGPTVGQPLAAHEHEVTNPLLRHPVRNLQAEPAQASGDEAGPIAGPAHGLELHAAASHQPSDMPAVPAPRDLVLPVRGSDPLQQPGRGRIGVGVVEVDEPAPELGVLQRHHPPHAPHRRLGNRQPHRVTTDGLRPVRGHPDRRGGPPQRGLD